jgi:acetoin utilization protein AcuB
MNVSGAHERRGSREVRVPHREGVAGGEQHLRQCAHIAHRRATEQHAGHSVRAPAPGSARPANTAAWRPHEWPLLCFEACMNPVEASPRSGIGHFMTPSPHSIGRDQTLSVAHERMRRLGVRHLPVLDGGRLVGIVSQRDLFFVETLRDVDPTKVLVEDAMSTGVYAVDADKALGEVAAKMVECKYGCAVVVCESRVVGIFTTSDALRVLSGIVDAWR